MLRKPVRILLAAMLAFFVSAAHAAPAEVYLIGTLYQRHDQVPAFSADVLRRVILAIKPDVLVLDVTPDELAKKVVHPSKIEYTRTVFPLLAGQPFVVYPAEPAEPMFTEIVSGLTARLRQWEQQDPAAAATYKRTERALFGVLIPYWNTASRVQNDVTAEALASLAGTQEMLVGDVLKTANARWDKHTADAVVAAAAKHPGTRILVLTGIRNRPHVKAHLAGAPQVRLVDMPAWLSKAGY